ncbi:MAG TPA: hypothetical protein VKU39_20970 [Streptosporangiaceae bacterium]|nr:hypothetical protein [Streptosporangiaceae bacterium]
MLRALVIAAGCGAFTGVVGPPNWVVLIAVLAFVLEMVIERCKSGTKVAPGRSQ